MRALENERKFYTSTAKIQEQRQFSESMPHPVVFLSHAQDTIRAESLAAYYFSLIDRVFSIRWSGIKHSNAIRMVMTIVSISLLMRPAGTINRRRNAKGAEFHVRRYFDGIGIQKEEYLAHVVAMIDQRLPALNAHPRAQEKFREAMEATQVAWKEANG